VADLTHTTPHTDHHADHRTDHRTDEHAGDEAEILALDAEVLAEQLAGITTWLPGTAAPRRIVDLGCGTGTGTFALLQRFPAAEVTAVDAPAGHLERLCEKAAAAGLTDRVRTVEADLDADWPDRGRPELVWASAALHHMADPDRTLRQVRQALASDGLFAVVELAGIPGFLPPDAPADRPGLGEERCHAALDRHHAEHLSRRGADWDAKLTAAGCTVEAERTVTVDLPGSATVGRYALSVLRRMRGGVAALPPAEDLAALDRLLDTDGPHSVLRRADLPVRTERMVWAARRAS
jgi:SAM-dependent methyltransferase